MTEPAIGTTDALLAFILSVLTPFLASASPADAHRAAQQTIAAYQAAGQDQLITIGQIAGFALASLDNLRLSAAPELSVPMKLKLRGNANALNRSSQRSATVLEHQRSEPPDQPEDSLDPPEPPVALEQPVPTPTEPAQDPKLTWAAAMTDVAAECARNLAKLPPKQRRAETIRISALNDTARHLRQGGALPTRSGLLSTTALGSMRPS